MLSFISTSTSNTLDQIHSLSCTTSVFKFQISKDQDGTQTHHITFFQSTEMADNERDTRRPLNESELLSTALRIENQSHEDRRRTLPISMTRSSPYVFPSLIASNESLDASNRAIRNPMLRSAWETETESWGNGGPVRSPYWSLQGGHSVSESPGVNASEDPRRSSPHSSHQASRSSSPDGSESSDEKCDTMPQSDWETEPDSWSAGPRRLPFRSPPAGDSVPESSHMNAPGASSPHSSHRASESSSPAGSESSDENVSEPRGRSSLYSSHQASRSSSPTGSEYSDTLTSMEYPVAMMPEECGPGSHSVKGNSDPATSRDGGNVLTPATNDTDDPPTATGPAGMSNSANTASHVITIDPAFPSPPEAPRPESDLGEVCKHITASVIYTLHHCERQGLEVAEAHAATYVARYVPAFEQAQEDLDSQTLKYYKDTGIPAPTAAQLPKLNAGYLYSCSKEWLVQIFSDNDPDPPKVVMRVSADLSGNLRRSKYGK
ncbi:MAG: hypothetical protein Q9169_004140, partial [Polycauliona sp. 2 TL-2023]